MNLKAASRSNLLRALSKRLQLATLVASGLAICSAAASAQVAQAAEAATVGLALNGLSNLVDQVINRAQSAGNTVAMKAGSAIALEIAAVRNAEQGALNDAFGHGVNPAIDATMSQLTRLVNDFDSGAIQTESDALQRAQTVASTLPLHNDAPQVSGVEPAFVVPSRINYLVTLSVRGNFEAAALKDMTPTLIVGSKAYVPSSISNQVLSFQVPVHELLSTTEDTSASSNYSVAKVTLSVPWKESHLLGLWHSDVTYIYPLVLTALPFTPGQLTLVKFVPAPRTETMTITSHGHVASTRESGNNDRIDVPIDVALGTDAIEQGWHIKPGTCAYGETAQGEHSHSDPNLDGHRCVGSVTTIHRSAGSSGRVDWSLSATAERTVPDVRRVEEPIQITWGEERQLMLRAEDWEKVVFTPFTGGRTELNSRSNNPFVSVV